MDDKELSNLENAIRNASRNIAVSKDKKALNDKINKAPHQLYTKGEKKGIDNSSAMVRSNSLCELKPHFIIKEYYGVPRRESQTFFIEEKIKKISSGNVEIKGIEGVEGDLKRISSSSLLDNIALLGGAFVGGAVGLWFIANNGGSVE
jgi:hypothetical protein